MRIKIYNAHCHAFGARLTTRRGAHSVRYGRPDSLLKLANHASDPQTTATSARLHERAQAFNPPVLPAQFEL